MDKLVKFLVIINIVVLIRVFSLVEGHLEMYSNAPFVDDSLVATTDSTTGVNKDAFDLYDRLFGVNSTYEPMVKPPNDIVISFSLQLIQIVQLNSKQQMLKTSTWPTAEWNDSRLGWNQSEFQIDILRVPAGKVWLPDINMVNNVDGKFGVSFECNVLIGSDGALTWVPPSILQSSCAMNVRYFPYDVQSCNLTFVSWAYTSEEIAMTSSRADAVYKEPGAFYRSTEWGIKDIPAIPHLWRLPGTDEWYSAVTYQFNLYRKPLFYEVTLMMPVILLMGLSLLAFYLPSDSGERITISISIIVALTMPLLILSKTIPSVSDSIPLMLKYITFSLVMVTLTLLTSISIIEIHWRSPSTHKMPNWVRVWFINILPKFLWLEHPQLDDSSGSEDDIEMDIFSQGSTVYMNKPLNTLAVASVGGGCRPSLLDDLPDSEKIEPEIEKAIKCVSYIAMHMKEENCFHIANEDWKYVAMVMDRIALYGFALFGLCGTLVLFLSVPSVPEQTGYSIFRM